MEYCDLIIAPRWLVTVDSDNRVLEDSAAIISDGRIVDVLPRGEAVARYQPGVLIERPDHALIPGLINAHTHAAMTLFRGMVDDLALETWLYEGIWPAEKRWISSEMVRDGTELAIAEMLSGGTTCFSDQYFYPEIAAQTAASMNMRAVIATPVVDFETNWAKDANDHMQKAADLVHDAYVDHPLISTAYAPHSPYALSDDSLRALRVMADQLDLRVQMHLHETKSEVEKSLRQHGKRPIARLRELGLVNASLLAVHAVHLDNEEIEMLADAGAAVAHCPKSNMKLASGFAPVARYRAAGIPVSIGTDGAASNNVLDMFSEMRAAALVSKGLTGDAASLPASTVLRLATAEAAQCLGLESELGSLEPGKWADIACVDLNRRHSQPVYDPVSQLVYTARPDQVSDVWVAGKQVVTGGELTDIDEDDIFARCNEWRQRMVKG